MENNSPSQTSLASPTDFAPKAFSPLPTLLTLAGAVFVLFVVIIAGGFAWVAVHGLDVAALTRQLSGLYGVEIQSAAEVLVVVYLALLLPVIGKCTLRDLGFRGIEPRNALVLGGAIVAMFVLVTGTGSLLENLLHVKAPEEAVKVFLSLHGLDRALFAIFAIVVGPVTEEFLFRIFLFNAMRKWWGFWPGAVVSSLLFGFAHMQPGGFALNISLGIPLAIGGMILCAVYVRTGSAWANMTTHACFNGISLLAILLFPQMAK